MKSFKLFFSFMALAAMTAIGFTSCSNEMDPQTSVREGEVDVVMTTSLPQALQTYAVNSADGGLKNLVDKGYQVRYIMEIYPKGSKTRIERQIKYMPLTSTGEDYRKTSFKTRLLAAEYDFVFWADIVQETNKLMNPISQLETPFYSNAYFCSKMEDADGTVSSELYRPTSVGQAVEGDLNTICATGLSDIWDPRTPEMYDGYSCTEAVDLRTAPTSQTFTLKRPFAKVRLVTTDAAEIKQSVDWTKTDVKIAETNSLPYNFNARTAKFEGNSGSNGYWTAFQFCGEYTDDSAADADKTLGVFYLPVSSEGVNLTFTVKVNDSGAVLPLTTVTLPVENIPLVSNKLITIKGNLLSKNATFNVTIDDEFEDDETIIEYGKEATTVDELKGKLSGGTEAIEYTGKVTKATGFTLDFSEIEAQPQTYSTATNPLFAEGNTAELTLKFSNVEENAVITFAGGINAPKKLRIVTETKCSLRIDLSSSDVYYDGSSYKYIVTNSRNYGQRTGLQYDAMFNAGGSSIFPAEYVNAHLFNINADFTLPENVTCTFVKKHQNKVCNFLHIVQTWLSSNSEKTVWNFVAEYEPTTTE